MQTMRSTSLPTCITLVHITLPATPFARLQAINADNEEHFAATAASQPGGKLSVVSLLPHLVLLQYRVWLPSTSLVQTAEVC